MIHPSLPVGKRYELASKNMLYTTKKECTMPATERSHPKIVFPENLSALERFGIVQTLSKAALDELIDSFYADMPGTEKILLQFDAREAFDDDRTKADEYVRSVTLFRLAISDQTIFN